MITRVKDTMNFLKNGFVLAGVAAILLSPGKANASTIANFATGYDNDTDSLISIGNDDLDWSITSAPSGTILGAAKVDYLSAWFNPEPQARWLVPKLTNGSTNLWDIPGGDYVFEYNFNLENGFNDLLMSGSMGADNGIRSVKLNGNSLDLIKDVNHIFDPFRESFVISFSTDNQNFFKSGINSLQVEMRNWSSSSGSPTPAGLVIQGQVTGTRSQSVPEPATILGLATVLGCGALLKREQSKKPNKS